MAEMLGVDRSHLSRLYFGIKCLCEAAERTLLMLRTNKRMDGDVEELVNGIETAFNVRLLDEVSNESSLADVLRILMSQIDSSPAGRCLSSLAFWRLRRALIAVVGVERAAITPATDLSKLIPTVERRRTWRKLEQTLDLKLPGLEYGKVASHLLLFAVLALAASTVFMGLGSHWLATTIATPLLLLLVVILSSMALFRIFRSFATKIPDHSRTAGDASKSIVGLNHARLVHEYGPSHEKELWEALRYVVMDITGAEPYLVQRETNVLDLVELTLLRAPV